MDGKERWKYKTGDRITGSPAVFTREKVTYVVVGSYDRHLYALDAHTGQLKWRYAARGGIYSSPALAMDRRVPLVLVSAWDHALHAISAETGERVFSRFTGRPLWEVSGLDESNWSSPAVARINNTWMVFFGSYDGTLRAFTLKETDKMMPTHRSNLAFWLSFPIVLTLVALVAFETTRRYRRRRRSFCQMK
jgi:outer membrane protein assembly factor BamB